MTVSHTWLVQNRAPACSCGKSKAHNTRTKRRIVTPRDEFFRETVATNSSILRKNLGWRLLQRDNLNLLDEPTIKPLEQMQPFDKIPQEVIDLISKQDSIPFVLADENDPSTQQICTTLTSLAQRAQDGAMTLSTVEVEAIQRVELILRSMIELMDDGGNATASELTEQIRLLASNKETSTEPELDQVLINVLAKTFKSASWSI